VMDHIEKKRDALGINVKKARKLYDMAERRALEWEVSFRLVGTASHARLSY